MIKIKGSSYDEGVRDFMYTMMTERPELSFLGAELSAIVVE